MDGGRVGRNVIHIIGGDDGPRNGANDRDDRPLSERRENFQIPSLRYSSSSMVELQRLSKSRHCKKFSSQEGCPFGDECTFIHDDEIKSRERTAIILGPGATGSEIGITAPPPALPLAPPPALPLAPAASNSTVNPMSWKTKICNKWERTGYCPFGSKCVFAHGTEDLHRYGGGLLVGGEANLNGQLNDTVATHSSVYRGGGGGGGSGLPPAASERPVRKWKGPDKISRIYGDWIDDIE
ncbi:hypothetical protein OSB04_029681 [Centaurea solstitialis]|uniref:C3H1-type domain-containing protein n=1 Tax=Centaurea solstitialis TaxID=347529 RepID=A0AA38SRH2_9ASTR|nr:hypothetical protein OSB04_029681 [Centaurea solstitialis]